MVETILAQDFSHPYTTAKEHVVELYNKIISHKLPRILELGSYKGISTVALAYGAKETDGFVCAVDLCDEITNNERVQYWQTITPPILRYIYPYRGDSRTFLTTTKETYDFIFHDAKHGDSVIEEYHLAWGKLNGNGILAIHDFDQITDQASFVSDINPISLEVLTDDRDRQLLFLYK